MSLARSAQSTRSSGFALILALALMAFLLLLLLSLTTFVQVETVNASSQLERIEARQNALLGMQVALGNLQASLGPDQRVTARASATLNDSADPSKRLWTGVWRTDAPNAFGGSPYPTDPDNPGRMENHPENATYFFVDTGLSFSEPLPGNGTEMGKVVIANNLNNTVFTQGPKSTLRFEARLSTQDGLLLQDIREETWWFGPGYVGGVQPGWHYDAEELIDFSQPQFSASRIRSAPMGMSIRRVYLGDLVGSGGALEGLVKRPWASLNFLVTQADLLTTLGSFLTVREANVYDSWQWGERFSSIT